MPESKVARFDLRLIGAGLGALMVTAMLFTLPTLFASTQPDRAASQQTAAP